MRRHGRDPAAATNAFRNNGGSGDRSRLKPLLQCTEPPATPPCRSGFSRDERSRSFSGHGTTGGPMGRSHAESLHNEGGALWEGLQSRRDSVAAPPMLRSSRLKSLPQRIRGLLAGCTVGGLQSGRGSVAASPPLRSSRLKSLPQRIRGLLAGCTVGGTSVPTRFGRGTSNASLVATEVAPAAPDEDPQILSIRQSLIAALTAAAANPPMLRLCDRQGITRCARSRANSSRNDARLS
ncbi:hypothetical protein J2Y70_001332 [Xanthomonas translucens]|nr:hypothetical protein [Xanthomonas translucens]